MIYICSPYSAADPAVRQWRFEVVCRATATMLKAGLITISPIVASHPLVAHGLDALDHEFWMRVDRPLLDACTAVAVLMLPGWRESKGVAEEIRIAKASGKPITYIDPATVGVDVSTMPDAPAPREEAACL